MKTIITSLYMMCLSMIVVGQNTVFGTVNDAFGDPLIGVNVSEKGTSNGTVTDINGNYTLDVSSLPASLVFTYIGFGELEATSDENGRLSVALDEGVQLNEVQVVGSRSYGRSATDSPVAVDVINVADIAAQTGKVEINQILQYAAPSFNATKQSGSDGADHVDPASLRGLGPDQTLVLINGKRRHQSSLVNVFGTRGRGNSGTDLNAIPASAIKRIEVLRDGASAQYGSDAIAGVINIVLKDKTDGVSGGVTYGAYSTAVGAGYAEQYGDDVFNTEGTNRALDPDGDKSFDGNTTKVDLNYGVGLGDDGYINFTTEYYTKDRTLRPGFSFRKGYGSAAVDQFQFMVNGSKAIGDKTDLYFFGGSGNRDTDAFAFSRGAPGADGDDRAVASLYPNGFTPRITSIIKDQSATVGVKHDLDNGWKADFSHSYGSNDFHYFIKGSNNASLGAGSPTDFDAGGHSLAMNVTGLDFTRNFEGIMSGLNLAFGTEFRSENFQIFAGQEASYANYDVNGVILTNPAIQDPFINEFGQQPSGGSQGFPGYSPSNVVDRNRSNLGLYGDAELNVSDAFLVTGALRFENYSDFGNTVNFKLATRYKLMDGLSARASVSSGFRAPSLAQIHYNLLFNNIVGTKSVRTLLASNTSTVAKGFGIKPLTEEKATNLALGFTYKTGGFTATVDGYQISVEDRIVLTDVFDASDLNVGADAAQFFSNGVDTKTSGVDLVLSYRGHIGTNGNGYNVGIAANFNNTEIENINNGDLNEFTFFGPFSQAYLEAAAPDFKIGFNAGLSLGKLDFQLNYTQFSEVILQDFQWVDSPATNQAEADALFQVATDTYETAGVLDLSLGYQLTEGLKLTIGANNVLNTYPTAQFDGWTDQGGFNDSVQMGSDGMYLFGRIGFNF
ncbi:MAG: iron complex outermembrane receptor protein [Saprospiraceae bacterium]|jgi:iron complex outermembrane receptor protein